MAIGRVVVVAAVLLLCNAVTVQSSQIGGAPVIGVMTQTYQPESSLDRTKAASGMSYIAAGYIKYLESAGARVVPIHFDHNETELTFLFSRINGLLLPGGGEDIGNPTNQYFKSVQVLWKLAQSANAAQDYFPIWGTCLGFQTLCLLASGNQSLLDNGFDAENYSIPLDYTPYARKSRMFSAASDAVFQAAGSQPITMNAHQAGVMPSTFASAKALSSSFNIISTNVDRQNKPFVSSMEAVNLPYYGTQWHPEKNSFEFGVDQAINHTPLAVSLTQYTAKFFVDECRKNNHAFASPDELNDYLIWNYNPIFTGKTGGYFEQVYVWQQ